MVESKQILIAAKKLIEERGWAKGDDQVFAEGARHGYCVVTACIQATHGRLVMEFYASIPVIKLFKTANGIEENASVGNWNDALERTKEDVLAAFDKAIEAAP